MIAMLLIAGLAVAKSAYASPQDPVFFAGVAFTGNAADIPKEFPHLSRILNAGANAQLSGQIRSQLQAHPGPINLVFDQLGSVKDGSRSVALALAIDRETASVDHIGDVYKTRLEISMQLLFFDFKEQQVLGGFPAIVDYIDAGSVPPTDDDLQRDFEGMVAGTKGGHSLASEFVALLAHVSMPSPASRHLRVTAVNLEPKALEYLHQHAPEAAPEILRAQIAQEFGKYLAANQRLSILPYASNQALGGSMAGRFIEGSAFELKIPEADYDISLDVAGFKEIEHGRSSTSTAFLYGAFVDAAVKEPLSGKIYFSQRIKQGAAIEVPITQTTTDHWTAAYDTLRLLFNNFTLALSDPDGKWASTALPPGPQAKAELSSLKGLVQLCR